MRSHIAKALQVRSKAIRNALTRYNNAATALRPPRRTLTWAEVVDYTFLSDFDILRDPEANAAQRAWAEPAARQLLDTYHKMNRAREELDRLDIEIKRFVTYIRDEREFLLKKELELAVVDPDLAFFVGKYRNRRGRFDDIHMKRLQACKDKLGHRFRPTLQPGVHIPQSSTATGSTSITPGLPSADLMDVEEGTGGEDDEGSQDGWLDVDGTNDDDMGEDARGEELSEVMEGLVLVSIDK